MLLTLNRDLSKSASIASRACGKAHVLARVICRHVVQDQCAGAIRVLDDDVMGVCLHCTSICVQQVKQCINDKHLVILPYKEYMLQLY